ncbi:MAG: Zn-dependent hydrolase [Bacteroidales bacterium]|jgi:hypothetical protein|nr:Zn-dependent hydrolase [Bacteroidales bacterium]
MRKILSLSLIIASALILSNCTQQPKKELSEMQKKANEFAEVELTSDISNLSANQKEMMGYLFDAAKIMNDIYWQEAYGDKSELLDSIKCDAAKEFAIINYGPWERLNNNKAFINGFGEKPAGANFYPSDMTEEEFNALDNENKTSLYTLVKRDDKGNLQVIPYHEAFKEETEKAVVLIKKAAELAEDAGFKKYLELRAEALLTDKYRDSDIAWLAMTDNMIDFVVGPIENYEDALYGYKAAHESFLLIKDKEWSEKLAKYTSLLPDLQKMLPVADKYKAETPGVSGNQLNAYDVVYYQGDCNAGSKTIAINLPNDEVVRNTKGSRKLQLKNSMKAKFDKIIVPISNVLIDSSQRKNVSFEGFFSCVMFHEVGHGLGVSYLVDDKNTTVRDALKNYYTSIEEGKADILALNIITYLYEQGELGEVDLMDYYVTFMTSIFRSSRFGVASSHGKANMMRFYYFQEKGAFTRNPETGTYKVNFEKMKSAAKELANKIIVIQGDGDIENAKKWIEKDGKIKEKLQKDLDRINALGIPRDIRFKQGKEVLGL